MNILHSIIEDYAAIHTEKEPEILSALNKETHLKFLQPHMISGHYQGRFLSIISKLLAPENILEIGTFTGYSTLCLAEGLKENGKIHTIEINEELESIQQKYFSKSPYFDLIIPHVGDAFEIIPQLDVMFDLVFIDAGKNDYDEYFELVIKKVRSGGCILSDNVLWKGKVLDLERTDKQTEAIRNYNLKRKNDKRINSMMLPIRDGLTLSIVN